MGIYGVIVGDGHKRGDFELYRSQATAKAEAKRVGGRVYRMPKEPEARVWDAPTFIACSYFVTSDAKPD